MFKAVFITERYSPKNSARFAQNSFSKRGTRLGDKVAVNKGYSYRDLTIILGICVALLVIFALWASGGSEMAIDVAGLTNLSKVKTPEVVVQGVRMLTSMP